MKILKKDVVEANRNFFSHWSPRDASDNDDDYGRKTERRITVSTEDDADLIIVRFDTALVWAIRDGTPDSDDVLTFLAGLFPLAGDSLSPQSIALNGINVLRDADDVVARIVKRQSQPFAASFFVPGLAAQPERYELDVRVEGYLRTSDDDENEHACIPEAWAELQAVPSGVEGRYNIGLEDATLARFNLHVPCQRIARQMVSEANLRALLKTNGGLISSTISAVGIHTVRFVFKRCAAAEEPPRVQPPEENPAGHKGSEAPGEQPGHHDAPPDGHRGTDHKETGHAGATSSKPARRPAT